MKFSRALEPLAHLYVAVSSAFFPTIKHILNNPSILLKPAQLSRVFFTHVWVVYGPGMDEFDREAKESLIPYASGIVLDLGAGHGHTVNYLKRDQVTKYVAVEPNHLMHPEIRKNATSAGYSEEAGELVVLDCGAEDFQLINSAVGGENQVDTIISILTLCSIPEPQATVRNLSLRVLKPGGQFLFCEHVLSPRNDVRWWQRLWTQIPIWSLCFGGCRLDRPTHTWIAEEGTWDAAASKTWGKVGDDEENIFWHQVGKFTKA
ncbi:hypothetical protein FRB99_003317 [Tulasnella sp. 403]|nr:hypothetical protein FRB99_003317 [Tulasnella sp. 403]